MSTNKPILFAWSFANGTGLIRAGSKEKAISWLLAEYGRANGPYRVHEASEDDIAWAEQMGCMTLEAD